MKKKQQGATFIGMALIAIAVVFIAIVGIKMVPTYAEYFVVKKVLSTMKTSGELKNTTIQDIRKSFSRRAGIDNVTSVTAQDLQITKNGGEDAVVVADYSVKVPIAGNVSVCMDFSTSSDKN